LNDGWTDPTGSEVVKARFTDLKLRSLYPGRVKERTVEMGGDGRDGADVFEGNSWDWS
jgi:hypothetical protein